MQSRILNVNPLVAVFDDVFGQDVADAAIAAGKDRLAQPTYGTDEGRVVGEKRTHQAAIVDQWSDPLLTELMTRISAIVRLPPEHAETSKLIRYDGEQMFDVHFDGYDEHGRGRENFLKGGQRLFTTICYLNDIEEEGQTAFPVLVFSNALLGSNKVHPDSAHAGFGSPSGQKWVLTVWWREHHFHIPRSYPPAEGDFLVY